MSAACCSTSVHGAILWFNGTYDLNDAYVDETTVPINYYVSGTYLLEKSLVYDEFVVPSGQTWTVTSLFADDQESYAVAPTKATWEIRSNMSTGSGGTVDYSGDTAVTLTTLTAADGNNYIDTEYQISATVPSDVLTAGTYWLAVAPDSAGYYGDQSYIETTSGANSVGQAPANGGETFINNNLTAGNGGLSFAAIPYNVAGGVSGTAVIVTVPEPTSVIFVSAVFAGFVGLTRRHRR